MHRRTKLMLSLTVALSIVAASFATFFVISWPAHADTANWPQFHKTPDHQGFNPNETALSPATVSSLALAWNAHKGSSDSSPAVVAGVVYVGSPDGSLSALDTHTGDVNWTYSAPGASFVGSTPAVVNGVVYIGSLDHYLYAVDTATHMLKWRYLTGDAVYASPVVTGGTVYVGSQDGALYALDAQTAALIWSYTTGGFIDSSPAVDNGVVYVGSWDGKLYAFSAAGCGSPTCPPLWTFTTNGAGVVGISFSSPAVANGVVYVGSTDHTFYAIDAATHLLKWSYPTAGYVRSSPAVANGVVYVGSWDDSVYAFDAQTGDLRWRFTTGGAIDSSPAVANGVVYIGSLDGGVYAFDAAGCGNPMCSPLWTYTISPGSGGIAALASPAVVDGAVYISSLAFRLLVSPPPPPHKVVVFLGGVCTATDDSTSSVVGSQLSDGQLDFADDANATFHFLQRTLRQQYGYSDADFLAYSYHGGFIDSAGLWHHAAYGPDDPLQIDLSTSIQALHDQLLVPYSQRHPNTTFILVGHSLGGLVAFQELHNVAAANYQRGLISTVVTVDSPLKGVTQDTFTLGRLLNKAHYVPDCAAGAFDVPLRGPAKTLLDLHDKQNLAATTQAAVTLANAAAAKGVHVANFGNTWDCLFAPANCMYPIVFPQGDVTTQWVFGSAAETQAFTDKLGCLTATLAKTTRCVGQTHQALLDSTLDPVALNTIAADVGPQT